MVDILKRSFLIVTILLLVHCVTSDVRTTVEGITVARKGGNLDCDSLVCPLDTALCRVTKINDPKDDKYFLRIRKCIDSNGAVLKKLKLREPTGSFNRTITVTLEAGEHGSVIFSDPNADDEA